MLCANKFCIFNSFGHCNKYQIEIDDTGHCKSYIYIDISVNICYYKINKEDDYEYCKI